MCSASCGRSLLKTSMKSSKRRLLLQEFAAGGLGGFFLQREMHAFVTAVLLRMAGLDALDANAQPQPPDRQLAQVEQSMRGSERHAVIAADVGGQAALFKKRSNTVKAKSSRVEESASHRSR